MKFLSTCFLYIVLTSTYLMAYDASPACYKDLQVNFFQPTLVNQALSMHLVDQSSWTPINKLLQDSSKRIPSIILAKAQNLRPNPLTPVFIPDVARQILEETLYETFAAVMINYNPYQQIKINIVDVQDMFNFILNRQAARFDNCLGPKK